MECKGRVYEFVLKFQRERKRHPRSFCMGILSLSLDFKWISHSQCIGVVYKALCRLVLGSAGRKVKQVGCGSLAVSPPHSSYLHHHHHILATTTSKPPPIKPHWSSHQLQHPFSVRFQKQLSTNVKKMHCVIGAELANNNAYYIGIDSPLNHLSMVWKGSERYHVQSAVGQVCLCATVLYIILMKSHQQQKFWIKCLTDWCLVQ